LDGHQLAADGDGVEYDVISVVEPEVLEKRVSHESS
jgi:hypothetical protein